MLTIENPAVTGWEPAIRGLRNPMNSWALSDTIYGEYYGNDENGREILTRYDVPQIGPNDLKLMHSLVRAGSDHAKFLRYLLVTVDVTAPLYWWKEYDTYKVGTVANSCSTMHKIHAKEFMLDDFSHEHLTGTSEAHMMETLDLLNLYRAMFLKETQDSDVKKEYWWQMIQLLPSSYNQKRTLLLNYQVLRNIYHARKHHKLDEWRQFCEWIETLPHAELITEVVKS